MRGIRPAAGSNFGGRSNVVEQIPSQPISVVRPVAVAGGFFVIRKEADVVAFSAVDEGLWYAASIHVKLNRGGADCFACEGFGSHKQIISSDLSILADEETQFSRLNTGDLSTCWWRGDADIVAACATGDCNLAPRQSHRHPERHGRWRPRESWSGFHRHQRCWPQRSHFPVSPQNRSVSLCMCLIQYLVCTAGVRFCRDDE